MTRNVMVDLVLNNGIRSTLRDRRDKGDFRYPCPPAWVHLGSLMKFLSDHYNRSSNANI